MRKKSLALLTGILMLFVCRQAAVAESLVGEWRGSANVSALPFSLSATVKLNEDGTFLISLTSLFGIVGLEARGAYTVENGAIAITPSRFDGLFASRLASPERVGTVRLPYTLQDGTLAVAGGAMGLDGSISLSRR